MLPEIQNHLVLLKWLLIVLIALVCPLLALMLGGTTASLASIGITRRTGQKDSPAWVNALLKRANPSAQHDTLVVLTVIASLLLFKIIYRPQLFSNLAWAGLIWMLATGLGLMVACRYRLTGRGLLDRAALAEGGIGVALVTVSYFALACTESLLLTPEYWPRMAGLPYLFLSWHGLARFAEFILLTGAITGNALLFSSPAQRPPEADLPPDGGAHRIGAWLALGSLFLWPVVLCLDMALIPALAASRLLSGLAVLSILLAASGVVWLAMYLQRRQGQFTHLFIGIVLLLFWCWAFMGHVAREKILIPATLAGLAPKPKPDTAKPQPDAAKPQPDAVARGTVDGKSLFEQKCTVCHSFDQRVVGPPLNDVVPNYSAQPAELKSFLQNPVKRNPDYPAMPNLGLTAEQAEAIAGYLLQQVSP